jgi:hypothetical protein
MTYYEQIKRQNAWILSKKAGLHLLMSVKCEMCANSAILTDI